MEEKQSCMNRLNEEIMKHEQKVIVSTGNGKLIIDFALLKTVYCLHNPNFKIHTSNKPVYLLKLCRPSDSQHRKVWCCSTRKLYERWISPFLSRTLCTP